MKGRAKDESRTKQIQAARRAFAAYEKAVKIAEEIAASKPPRGLGVCVMTGTESSSMTSIAIAYECSECGGTGGKRCKFCPDCGAEIIRFETRPAPTTMIVSASVTEPEKKEVWREQPSLTADPKVKYDFVKIPKAARASRM